MFVVGGDSVGVNSEVDDSTERCSQGQESLA